MKAEDLKSKLKSKDNLLARAIAVRVHRAISWLARAEAEPDDSDAQFIFLWISFNAAYAHELGTDIAEREKLGSFFVQLLSVDSAKKLHGILFHTFSGPIRT